MRPSLRLHPKTARSISGVRHIFVIALLAAGACAGGRGPARQASPAPPQPIPVEWSNRAWGAAARGGWRVRNCTTPEHPSLCVDRDGRSAGTVRLKDLPSLGEEKTTSPEQVQAVLAGRINSLYQFKVGRWAHACGSRFKVSTSRPRMVAMGQGRAMKYELTGAVGGQVAERLVGYWTFRDGIETIIEASAGTGERCRIEPLGQIAPTANTAEEQMFTPQTLRRFEPLLDRLVAGSRLPPPTQFTPKAG